MGVFAFWENTISLKATDLSENIALGHSGASCRDLFAISGLKQLIFYSWERSGYFGSTPLTILRFGNLFVWEWSITTVLTIIPSNSPSHELRNMY